MEHTVTAPLDGTVADLLAKTGQQVAIDETLAILHTAGEPPSPSRQPSLPA
jgi:acetyl-CoA/propionyl-CoA carboxylase biotin carboxyl carrier protein